MGLSGLSTLFASSPCSEGKRRLRDRFKYRFSVMHLWDRVKASIPQPTRPPYHFQTLGVLVAAGIAVVIMASASDPSSTSPQQELPPSPPFLRAVNNQLKEADVFRAGTKSSPTFAILCDPQLGFKDGGFKWEDEQTQLRDAVHHINRLRPDFVVLIGDLAQQWPHEKERLELRDRQLASAVAELKELDPSISLIITAGNHDVGNRPTAESIQRHEAVFGDADFSFRWTEKQSGSSSKRPATTLFIVVNSSLLFDPSGAPKLAEKQAQWIDEELRRAREDGVDQILFFGHHPFFVKRWDEDSDVGEYYIAPLNKTVKLNHFQIKQERRLPLLRLLQENNVKYSFHGHTHWNSVTESNGFTQIVTTAIGMQLGADQPGLRMVHLDPSSDSLQHRFYTLEELFASEEGATPVPAGAEGTVTEAIVEEEGTPSSDGLAAPAVF